MNITSMPIQAPFPPDVIAFVQTVQVPLLPEQTAYSQNTLILPMTPKGSKMNSRSMKPTDYETYPSHITPKGLNLYSNGICYTGSTPFPSFIEQNNFVH